MDQRFGNAIGLGSGILGLLVLGACAEAVGPPGLGSPTSLERVSAEELRGVPGFPLADSGAASPDAMETDGEGRARARWVLGPAPGRQLLQVTADGNGPQALSFAADADWGLETSIESMSGGVGGQMPVGCPVADPLRVRVTGVAGMPVAGAPVLFGREGADAAAGEMALTDGQGIATHAWRVAGEWERVVARIATPGSEPASFEVRGVPTASGGVRDGGPHDL